MDRLEESSFPIPAPRVFRHQPVFVDQSDFLHRGHHDELPVGVQDRHGVFVGQSQPIAAALAKVDGESAAIAVTYLEKLLAQNEAPLGGG